MSSTAIPRADDVFFCPRCGQKHRGDLSAPRAGAQIRAKCAACGTELWIRWKRGRASVRAADPGEVPSWTVTTSQISVPANLARTASFVGALPATRRGGTTPDLRDAPEEDVAADAGGREAPPASKGVRDRAPPEGGEKPDGAEFAPGATIGRYLVAESIGRGGTGSVYRAFDARTNRYVALKILGARQPDVMRQRFLREIEVQANLRHPNLMPVFDRGEHQGRPFFTMEMLYRPFNLTEIVRMGRDGSLQRYATLKHLADPEAVIREVFLPVCEAMQVASVENGVVHRDLKPDNVLVDSRTLRPYVIDFGICHVLERRSRVGGVVLRPTADDAGIVGTPRYLAPEQSRGTVHERTDIWGLGAILRFCLTGEPPVASAQAITRAELKRRVRALTEAQEVALRQDNEEKAALCAEKLARLEDTGLRTYDDVFEDAREGVYTPLPPEIPEPVVAILHKAMALRPGDRYENPSALAEDVTAWLSGQPTHAQLAQGTSSVKVARGFRRALRLDVLGGVAVVLALAGTYALGHGTGRGTADEERAATAQAVLSALEAQIEGAARLDPATLPVSEAYRTHDALHGAIDAARSASAGADALPRWEALAARVAPQRVLLDAPASVTDLVVEDESRRFPPALARVDDLRLAPGDYVLTIGTVRIPLHVPLLVLPRVATPGHEAARPLHLTLPLEPSAVPESMVLVVPGDRAVLYRGMPWSAPVASTPVDSFLIDRRETSNADWEAFLEAIPDGAERARRAEAVDFVRDLSRPGHYSVPRGVGVDASRRELPVRGVSPADALAYCAWRSTVENATVRLPTEAEWAAAAGAALDVEIPVGPDAAYEKGVLRALVPVGDAPDLSPYGVRGLLGNAREIVTALGGPPGSAPLFLVKGAGAGEPAVEAALRLLRPIGRDEREHRTGFRCVREVRAK